MVTGAEFLAAAKLDGGILYCSEDCLDCRLDPSCTRGTDCSGLMVRAAKRTGLWTPDFPSRSEDQLAWCKSAGTLVTSGVFATTPGAWAWEINPATNDAHHIVLSNGDGERTFEAPHHPLRVGYGLIAGHGLVAFALIPGVHDPVPPHEPEKPMDLPTLEKSVNYSTWWIVDAARQSRRAVHNDGDLVKCKRVTGQDEPTLVTDDVLEHIPIAGTAPTGPQSGPPHR